jgi:hypothetical protein
MRGERDTKRLLHPPSGAHRRIEELTKRRWDVVTTACRQRFQPLLKEGHGTHNFQFLGESKKKVLFGPKTNVSSGIASLGGDIGQVVEVLLGKVRADRY